MSVPLTTLPPSPILEFPPYRDDEDEYLCSEEYVDFLLPPSALPHLHTAQSTRTIIILVYIIIFITSFGGHLIGVPALRVYEDILCRQYYAGLDGEQHVELKGTVDESMCKGEAVQYKLNILLAGLHFLGALVGLVMTVPYGLLADRIGRKPVFLLALVGSILGVLYSFGIMYLWEIVPVKLVWACALFELIGGGAAVSTMMLYAMGSDITTDANRANVFMWGAAAGLVPEIIAPSVAGFLMQQSPWIPLLAGLGLLILAILPALFLPETFHHELKPTPASEQTYSPKKGPSLLEILKVHVSSTLRETRAAIKILNTLPIILLLIPFTTLPFAQQATGLSLRYISTRFLWPLRKTAFLLSLRSIISLFLLAAILPSLSHLLATHLLFTAIRKDLFIARFSLLFLIFGAFLIALSQSITPTILGLLTLTLGNGLASVLRSLITTLVNKEHVGILYSAIAVVEIASALVATPVLAGLWALGLKWGGAWIGLPFIGLGVVVVVGGAGVWIFGWLGLDKGVLKEEEGTGELGLVNV